MRANPGRNSVILGSNQKTYIESTRLPDQTRHSMFLKEMIELRAVQNGIKNKLRKVLFGADKGKKKNGQFVHIVTFFQFPL